MKCSICGFPCLDEDLERMRDHLMDAHGITSWKQQKEHIESDSPVNPDFIT